MNKKYFWIIGIVVVVLAVAGFSLFAPSTDADAASDASQAELVSVESGILEATVGATGKVRAEQSAILVWETSGKVESVNINVGNEVSDGEVLATLAQTSLPQSVILAQADLINAQQNLEDLLDSANSLAIAEAERTLALSQETLDEKLNEWDDINWVGSQEEIDDAYSDMQKAYQEMKQAEADRDKYAEGSSNYKIADKKYRQARSVYATALGNYNYYSGQTVDEYEKAVIAAELEVAKQEVTEAEEAYEDLIDGVDADDVAAAEARVAAAEANLNAAWIEAPFDGTITDVSAIPGDLVNPNEQAFILNNLETLLIDLEISEIDINQIEIGQQVLITFDAIPVTEYEGVVVEVSMDGIETAGVVDFPVIVQITNPDEQIRLGMTASVEIIVVQQDAALLIPNQAIRVEDGIQVVYYLDNQGNMVAVPVVLGFSSNTYSEVLESSLADGDQIVLNPSVILNQTTGDESFDQLREMGGESGEGPGAGPGQFFGGDE